MHLKVFSYVNNRKVALNKTTVYNKVSFSTASTQDKEGKYSTSSDREGVANVTQ